LTKAQGGKKKKSFWGGKETKPARSFGGEFLFGSGVWSRMRGERGKEKRKGGGETFPGGEKGERGKMGDVRGDSEWFQIPGIAVQSRSHTVIWEGEKNLSRRGEEREAAPHRSACTCFPTVGKRERGRGGNF